MPNPQFPHIPYAPIYSYEEEPEDPSISAKMDDGSVISRPKFTKSRLTLSFPWKMSSANKAVLLNFYRAVVKGRSLVFDFVHPDPDSEFYGNTLIVRFKTQLIFKKLAPGWWSTTVQLEED